VFDPRVITYDEILKHFVSLGGLSRTENECKQYRSAILVHSKAQRDTAVSLIRQEKEKQGCKFYTAVEVAGSFYRAEEYHQKYVQKSKPGYRSSWNWI
jgi:peptide-methionine (S)-S-oxide reductase